MDAVSLPEVLRWLVNLGGAAVLVYWLMDNVPQLATLRADYRRYAALALTFLAADAGLLLQIVMLYAPEPVTWRAWVEALFAAGATAAGVGQALHAAVRLGKAK